MGSSKGRARKLCLENGKGKATPGAITYAMASAVPPSQPPLITSVNSIPQSLHGYRLIEETVHNSMKNGAFDRCDEDVMKSNVVRGS